MVLHENQQRKEGRRRRTVLCRQQQQTKGKKKENLSTSGSERNRSSPKTRESRHKNIIDSLRFFLVLFRRDSQEVQTMSSPTIPQSSSSQTVTVVEPERLEAGATINRILVLKLRQKQKKITWTDDTVDNEHLGRKSSKRKIS